MCAMGTVWRSAVTYGRIVTKQEQQMKWLRQQIEWIRAAAYIVLAIATFTATFFVAQIQ
jgi:hypothetical protein